MTNEEERLERDLRTALANSPHPLTTVIGISIEGKSWIVGIMEEVSAPAFVAFYNGKVRNATFTIWDGRTIRKGNAYDVFKTTAILERERLQAEHEIYYD